MEWLPTKHIQSVSILKKNNLRSAIVLSKSSKHRLLLSRQMHHIKQWGTAIQITPLWWRLNLHKYFNRYRITYSLIFKITITNYTNQLYLKSPPPQTPFHKRKGVHPNKENDRISIPFIFNPLISKIHSSWVLLFKKVLDFNCPVHNSGKSWVLNSQVYQVASKQYL